MKNNMTRKVTIAMVLCGISLISVVFSAAAEPTVENVTLYPAEPWPESTVTFNVTFSEGTSLDEVWFYFHECNRTICFLDSQINNSMTLISPNTYQLSVELAHGDSYYIQYQVIMKSEGTWSKTNLSTVYLSEPPTNNNDTDGDDSGPGDNNDGKSPGFELIVVFLAITATVYIVKRKR